MPDANGQGTTEPECLEDLASAVRTLLEIEREEALEQDRFAIAQRVCYQ